MIPVALVAGLLAAEAPSGAPPAPSGAPPAQEAGLTAPAAAIAPPPVEARARPTTPAAPGANLLVPALHDLALMSVMRGVESYLWPDPFARPRYFGAHYEEAFTKAPLFDASAPAFRWDGDRVSINVAGHGLFGSELYLRARQCRLGVLGALGTAAVASTLWEYGFEGNGVRPSAQDLVYTPLAGLVFGELRWIGYRAAGRIAGAVPRAVVRAVLDPLGEAERALGTPC